MTRLTDNSPDTAKNSIGLVKPDADEVTVDLSTNVHNVFRNLLTLIVDDPNQLRFLLKELDSETTLIEVYAADRGMGQLIGKQGRMSRALRTILGAVGKAQGHRFRVDIRHDEQDVD